LKNRLTRKNILSKILMLSVLLCLHGCVYLVVGGIGAVGGYVVSPDTVEGITENDSLAVWDTTVEIVSIMGTIDEQNEDSGILIAVVNGAKVAVTVEKLTETSTKLTVKARKNYLPKITIAQDVFVKIMSQLNDY